MAASAPIEVSRAFDEVQAAWLSEDPISEDYKGGLMRITASDQSVLVSFPCTSSGEVERHGDLLMGFVNEGTSRVHISLSLVINGNGQVLLCKIPFFVGFKKHCTEA